MRLFTASFIGLVLAGACGAQQWELGASGGVGLYTNKSVSSGSASGTAGFKPGAIAGVVLAQDLYEHLGGAIRYEFQFSKLKVSSGGTEFTFGGQSHAIHYDLMFYGGKRDSATRPFVVAGGGVKLYRGTGSPHAAQPLGNLAALTNTQQVEGLITFGGGVKFKVGSRAHLYLEGRDFLTRFPNQVVAPVPPGKLSGWIHDFVPMVSLSVSF